MHPILFSFKNFNVYSYGLMVALGMIISMMLIEKEAKKVNISQDKIIDLMFWSIIWGIIGARVFYVLLYPEAFKSNWIAVFKIYEGGLVFHGGLIFGTIAAFFNFKIKKLPVFKTLDLLALYMPLAHAFGRIGCFLNGCCPGKACESILAVNFPGQAQSVYPTQLYSAVMLLIIFIILKRIRLKQSFIGQISASYLVLYGTIRFLIEFFRDNPVMALGLSLYQFISLVLIISGIIMHLKLKHKNL
jgi:phosphatidylglycerol:prolipoprotein diacylglycerol transferase